MVFKSRVRWIVGGGSDGLRRLLQLIVQVLRTEFESLSGKI